MNFKIFNSKNQEFNALKCHSPRTNIEFHINRESLLSISTIEDRVIIFYGYLDMSWNQFENPAEFLNATFADDLKYRLNEIFGSFCLFFFDHKQFWFANDALGDFLPSYIHAEGELKVAEFAEALLNQHNKSINQQRVLHYFGLTHPETEISFFKDINQLAPGRVMEFHKSHFTLSKYYSPKQQIRVQKSSWSEDLKAKLIEVIQLQTYGLEAVNVQLSGGMDSSLVMAMGIEAKKEMIGHSYVFPRFPEADESLWIDAMSKMNVVLNRFAGESYWPLKSPWYVSANSPLNSPYANLKEVIYSKTSESKFKHILSGDFADHLYTGYIYWLVDLFKKKPLNALGQFIKVIKHQGLISGLRQISPKKWTSKYEVYSQWLLPELKKQLQDELNQQAQLQSAHSQQHRLVFGTTNAQYSHKEMEMAHRFKIHIRNPFRDRRIVEHLISAPAWELGDAFNNKKMARLAGQGHLPDSIIRRRKVTTLKPLYEMGLFEKELPKVKDLLLNSTSTWQDYVKSEKVLAILNNPNAPKGDSDSLLIWYCVCYELWMRRLALI